MVKKIIFTINTIILHDLSILSKNCCVESIINKSNFLYPFPSSLHYKIQFNYNFIVQK